MPWSIVSGVRSSCEAVETKALRAASWRRSSSCIRPSARARSPTSSRPRSVGAGASGPSAVIRSAARRRRPSRRVSVLESASPSPIATASPTAAAVKSALRTSFTAVVTSVRLRSATSTPAMLAVVVERHREAQFVVVELHLGRSSPQRPVRERQRAGLVALEVGVVEERGRLAEPVRERHVGDQHARAAGALAQVERRREELVRALLAELPVLLGS